MVRWNSNTFKREVVVPIWNIGIKKEDKNYPPFPLIELAT